LDVTLSGSSPSTVTAGIMLLTRARQLGFHLTVSIVGDETDVMAVRGPAVAYAPVLASCGVGRELGSGATVVLPGPASEPILVSVQPHGIGGWFPVDRTGSGAHPATQAFVRLSRDPRMPARRLGRDLRRAMEALGVAPDTAVLDVLFGAPVPPLLRLALALRAGRAMSGGRGESVTRFLAGTMDDARDPLDPSTTPEQLLERLERGELTWILDRMSTTVRDAVEAWVTDARALAAEDGGRDLILLVALTEVASQLAQLPVHSILPPLGAAEDSVAVGLAAALHADGEVDANAQMCQVFRFLGGRFVATADRPLVVSDTPPPKSRDKIDVLQWFSNEVRAGRKKADALWDEIFDPAQ
jgi:hypothetical protein